MKPGRPKRGESVPSKTVKTWLDAEQLDLVQRRGGGPYVRRLILADLTTRTKPVEEHRYKVGRSMVEVKVPAEVKARIMELGGSAYVRQLVGQACQLQVLRE